MWNGNNFLKLSNELSIFKFNVSYIALFAVTIIVIKSTREYIV